MWPHGALGLREQVHGGFRQNAGRELPLQMSPVNQGHHGSVVDQPEAWKVWWGFVKKSDWLRGLTTRAQWILCYEMGYYVGEVPILVVLGWLTWHVSLDGKCVMLDCDSEWRLIGCSNQSKGFPLALEVSVSYECEQYFEFWVSFILHACLSVWQLEDFLIVALSLNGYWSWRVLYWITEWIRTNTSWMLFFHFYFLHFLHFFFPTFLHFCVACVNLQMSAFLHFCVTCVHFSALLCHFFALQCTSNLIGDETWGHISFYLICVKKCTN